MKKDMCYMRHKRHDLKHEMKNIMEEKFGKVVDINELELAIIRKTFHRTHVNELEEVVLKKLVYNLRIQLTDIKSLYMAELNSWNAKIARGQDQLLAIIKNNTRRLNLLSLVSQEKKELVKIVALQPKKRDRIDKMEKTHIDYLQGIEKLEDIIDEQCRQIQDLKAEIKMLKTKGLPARAKLDDKPEGEEKVVLDWSIYDKYEDETQEEKVLEHKPFSQEITIPGYIPKEIEDMLTEMVNEIMDKVDSKLFVQETVRNLLSSVMKCTSVVDIINQIIVNLPDTPTDEQRGIIESTSEKIYQIQEFETNEENISKCAKEIIEEIVDQVLMIANEPHEVVILIIEKLLESLPSDYILKEESLDTLTKKVSETLGDKQLDKQALAESLNSIPILNNQEMKEIISVILERVFQTGIDYLFIIKNE